MSADNGTYILATTDGYRVTNAQAIDNIYWWWDNIENHINRKFNGNSIGEVKQEINPIEVWRYFKGCKVFETMVEVMIEATIIEGSQRKNCGFPSEYGIRVIEWSVRFPISLKEAIAMTERILKEKVDKDQ